MKQHVEELCEIANCKSKACSKRHPKICKFFTAHNTCKFSGQCAYHHKTTKAGKEIIEIIIKINALENTVTLLSEKIIILEEELNPRIWLLILFQHRYSSVTNVITGLAQSQF